MCRRPIHTEAFAALCLEENNVVVVGVDRIAAASPWRGNVDVTACGHSHRQSGLRTKLSDLRPERWRVVHEHRSLR